MEGDGRGQFECTKPDICVGTLSKTTKNFSHASGI